MNRSGMPVWRCISRRANASAVAERHRLPVHTNSTLKVGCSSEVIGQPLPDDSFDLRRRDRALAKHAGLLAGEIDDGRGRAAAGRAVVEEHVDVPAELLDDLHDVARGRHARPVRAGHGQRPGPLDERERELVLGHPHGHSAAGVAEVPADPRRLAQHDRQRARPELGDQQLRLLRDLLDQPDRLPPVVHQHRQRQVAPAPLGDEQRAHRAGVERVAAEPVDRVGRQYHQAPTADDAAADLDQRFPLLLVLRDLDEALLAEPLGQVGPLGQIGHAGHRPSAIRVRPVRSGRTATSSSPAPASSEAAVSPWSSPISQTSHPPGASHLPTRATTRRSTSSPSGPPSTARSLRLRRAQASASTSTSVASTLAPGTASARKQAIAPDPVHRSTAVAGAVAARRWVAAASATSSLSGRGTNTPRPTLIRSAPNGAQPITYCRGSPATRRATIPSSARAASGGSGWPRLGTAPAGSSSTSSSSQRASALADTQPAADSRAVVASSAAPMVLAVAILVIAGRSPDRFPIRPPRAGTGGRGWRAPR